MSLLPLLLQTHLLVKLSLQQLSFLLLLRQHPQLLVPELERGVPSAFNQCLPAPLSIAAALFILDIATVTAPHMIGIAPPSASSVGTGGA